MTSKWSCKLTHVALTALLFLTACTTIAQQQQTRMANSLRPWVGQSVASFVAQRGYPSSSVKIAGHTTAFRWVLTGQSAGAIMPIGAMIAVAPPHQVQCTVVMTASSKIPNPELKDYVITSYSWNGAC